MLRLEEAQMSRKVSGEIPGQRRQSRSGASPRDSCAGNRQQEMLNVGFRLAAIGSTSLQWRSPPDAVYRLLGGVAVDARVFWD